VREESAYHATGWRNPWSAAARRRFRLRPAPQILLRDADGAAQAISQRVWQPLHAADAALWGQGDQALRVDYQMVAQLDDWVRVGDVLLQQGSFAGERIASPDWIRAILAADLDGRRHPVWLGEQQGATGSEPAAARDVFWLDLGAGVRLWLVPRRGLSVLLWSAKKDGARDTEVPNLFIRALTDQAPAVGSPSALDQMVPGHEGPSR
jgi:CubicO group peptidase (beta-lactamase class C family)